MKYSNPRYLPELAGMAQGIRQRRNVYEGYQRGWGLQFGPSQINGQQKSLKYAFTLGNENDDLYELYLKMKLSPMTLASCWKLNDDMNNLTWHLVLPKCDNGQSVKADNFGQYRALGKRLEILDITDIDIERTCAFLDMVYDFPQQTNSPPKFTGV